MTSPTRFIPLLLGLSVLTGAPRGAADDAADPRREPSALAASFRFEEAAAAYEKLAHDLGGTAEAPRALALAARFRLGLGQVDEARADARAAGDLDREAHAGVAAQVTLMRAHQHAGLLEWEPLRALLVEAVPVLDRRAAKLDDRLEAHALLGRALVHLGKPSEAAAEHRRVLALAKRAAVGEVGADAVGEARFFFADEVGRAASAIGLEPYHGSGDRKAIAAYLTGPAARWLTRRKAAAEAAERAYRSVLGVEVPPPPPPPRAPRSGVLGLLGDGAGGDPNAPTAPWGIEAEEGPLGPAATGGPPSPRWAMAAAASVGLGWAELAETLGRLPILRGEPDPIGEHGQWICILSLEPPEDGYRQRARTACEAAVHFATRYRIADERSEACLAWLHRNHPASYPAFDELLPAVAAPAAAGVFAPALPAR